MRRLLHWYSRRLPVNVIYAEPAPEAHDAEPTPLFERYYLGQAFGWTIYLHHYLRTDPDRGVHDHPWRSAIAIILAGSYIERRLTGFNRFGGAAFAYALRRAGKAYRLTGTDFHALILNNGTVWSLFAHRPFVKGWGFLREISRAQWTGPGLPSVAFFPYGSDPDEETSAKWRARPRGREIVRAAP